MRDEGPGDQSQTSGKQNQHDDGVEEAGGPKIDVQV
jgi:hypothetical protein